MKNLEFKDVTARYEDADGDEQTHTARIAVVTREQALISTRNAEGDYVKRPRQVTSRDGTATILREGDAVIETDRPDVYDVLPAELYASTGYATGELVRNVGAMPAAVRATEPDAPQVSSAAVDTKLDEIKDLIAALARAQLAGLQVAPATVPSDAPDVNTDPGPGVNIPESPDAQHAQHDNPGEHAEPAQS